MKGVGCFLFLQQMTGALLQFCQTKKLRPKTMSFYEQTLKLFARWLEEEKEIETVERWRQTG